MMEFTKCLLRSGALLVHSGLASLGRCKAVVGHCSCFSRCWEGNGRPAVRLLPGSYSLAVEADGDPGSS